MGKKKQPQKAPMKNGQQNNQTAKPRRQRSKSQRRRSGSRRGSARSTKSIAIPAAYAQRSTYQAPRQRGGKDGCHVIRHREVITQILGNSSALSIVINPANITLLPWGSQIATSYQMYRFRKLVFEFRPNVSTASNGSIWQSILYEPASPLTAVTVQTLSPLAGTTKNSVFLPGQIHRLDPRRVTTRDKFFVAATVPSNASINDYDTGIYYLLVDNLATDEVVGWLEVDYELELFAPCNSTLLETTCADLSGQNSFATGAQTYVLTSTYSTPLFETGTAGGYNTFTFNTAWAGTLNFSQVSYGNTVSSTSAPVVIVTDPATYTNPSSVTAQAIGGQSSGVNYLAYWANYQWVVNVNAGAQIGMKAAFVASSATVMQTLLQFFPRPVLSQGPLLKTRYHTNALGFTTPDAKLARLLTRLVDKLPQLFDDEDDQEEKKSVDTKPALQEAQRPATTTNPLKPILKSALSSVQFVELSPPGSDHLVSPPNEDGEGHG